jgi:hypothetical protein
MRSWQPTHERKHTGASLGLVEFRQLIRRFALKHAAGAPEPRASRRSVSASLICCYFWRAPQKLPPTAANVQHTAHSIELLAALLGTGLHLRVSTLRAGVLGSIDAAGCIAVLSCDDMTAFTLLGVPVPRFDLVITLVYVRFQMTRRRDRAQHRAPHLVGMHAERAATPGHGLAARRPRAKRLDGRPHCLHRARVLRQRDSGCAHLERDLRPRRACDTRVFAAFARKVATSPQ